MHAYDELSIRITPSSVPGSYGVVASGAAGDESGEFVVPFKDLEVDNFVLRMGRTRRSTRRLESPEMAHAKAFGGRLFDALFSDRVRDIYRRSREMATDSGKGTRVSLKLSGAPELLDLPWEYLFDDPDFLSISTQTPIVRYLDLPARQRPLAVEPPLRILGMVSNPEESVPLAVDEERARLETSLRPLIDQGLVEVRWCEQSTLKALQRELRERSYHVFHFIGHGGFDEQSQDGLLLLEDERHRGRPISGWQLGTILRDHTSLRLAVLNACEGARSATQDPFAGVASGLVQREIPAVIAMQFEITDRAAIIFAEELYAALVNSYPIDAALAEARKAIFADGNDIEWGTPTLFLRVPDGRIFNVKKAAPHAPIPSEPPAPRAETEPPAVDGPRGEAQSERRPMDHAILSADLVALLAPQLSYLTGSDTPAANAAADRVGKAIGAAAVERSIALWDRLWPRLRSRSRALAAIVSIAEDSDALQARAALAREVAALLADEPQLARDTAALLRDVRDSDVAIDVGSIAVSGDGNVVQFGERNINIGHAQRNSHG